MKKTSIVQLEGHIIDSLTLSKIMDLIIDAGAKCNVEEVIIGKEKTSISSAKVSIEADSSEVMDKAMAIATKHGATVVCN